MARPEIRKGAFQRGRSGHRGRLSANTVPRCVPTEQDGSDGFRSDVLCLSLRVC